MDHLKKHPDGHAIVIDGAAVARNVRESIKTKIRMYRDAGKRAPNLAVVLVGDNPASQIYVSSKEKACAAVGIQSKTLRLPSDTSQSDLLKVIRKLNATEEIDGILVQLPLPGHLSRVETIAAIDPAKDVDGLTPYMQGMLAWDLPGLYPCTPCGIMELIRAAGVVTKGKRAAVIGRSILVGGPTATMLSHAGATVTSLHSQSIDVPFHTRQADIVVVATGVHHLVKSDWIKPGATVIDVGIHRVNGAISGDVDYAVVAKVAGAITPVPGGVGPMTIAMLLSNCVMAFENRT